MSEACDDSKKILLISDNDFQEKIFDLLCENKDYVVCNFADNLNEVEELIVKADFDIIICSSKVNEEDALKFFYKRVDLINDYIPLIFILKEKMKKKDLKYFKNIKFDFLYEEYLSVHMLDYTIQSSLKTKNNNALLKENELRYRSLFDHTLDVNFILDNDFKIIDSNVEGRKNFRLKKSLNLKEIFTSKDDFSKFKNLLNEVEQVSRFETKIVIKKKTYICLLDAFTIYDTAFQKSGSHLIIRNIDAIRKSQNLADRASKLIITGKLLRSLAHEIRNPLTNINLALDQFTEEVAISEDEAFYLDIVKRGYTRINDILDEIMNAYKTSEIVLKKDSLNKVIENALRFANDRLMLKNIKVKTSLRLKNDFIPMDKIKLTTAILNFIINASEAINHEDGLITIKTSKLEGKKIKLSVIDNGVGMNENQLKVLFDPFYTGKAKGLGLGLTTSQNTILAHFGNIHVESTPNVGTTFNIILPYSVE